MFAINFKQAFPFILAVLLIGCIFPTGVFAQQGKIDADVLDAAKVQETVTVVIYLQDRPPSRQIAEGVKAQFRPNIDATSRQIRDRIRPFRRQRQPLPLNVKAEVRALHEALDNETRQMRQEIGQQLRNRVAGSQQRVREAIEQAGGTVYAQIAQTNEIEAELPANAVNQIAALPEVRRVGLDTEPVPALDVSAPTIRVSSFWNAGYDGGPYDIGIVEHGVQKDHPDLRPDNNECIERNPGAEAIHGTKVAGVVASTHDDYKGIATGLDKILDASFPMLTWADAKNAMQWALTTASDDAEVINYSFHGVYGGDLTMDEGDPDYVADQGGFLDGLIDDYDVLIVKAAGNQATPAGIRLPYTLTWGSDSYNAIIVAGSVDQNNPNNRPTDWVYQAGGKGPTPAGRKKPDLTAPAWNIMSTNLGGGTWVGTGTSMATPHVSGALLLFWDHGLWHPALLKALLINSAEDRDAPGWDSDWGWGYIDLDAALDQYDYVMVGSIGTGNEKWYSGTMNAGETVTLVWLKHAGQSLANLDMYLYDVGTGGFIGASVSGKDNVEQIELNSGTNRAVYIKVGHWGGGSSSETLGFAPPSDFQSISPPLAPAAVSLADEEGASGLENSYPNPFNPETWIPYRLASEADVVIRIYNVDGQRVRTLDLGKQSAGRYIAKNRAAFWDGRNEEGGLVASGVYFYTLEVNGEKIESRKMILQK